MDDWERAQMLAEELGGGVTPSDVLLVLGMFQGNGALVCEFHVDLRGAPKADHAEIASRYLRRAWALP